MKPRSFRSAALSDKGPVRSNNEDRVHADDARGIFIVVDGMGGHEAGEQAAEIAIEQIRKRLESGRGPLEARMRSAIANANNAVYEAARKTPEWSGMACVLTAVCVNGGRAVAGHVGDSRLYKIRHGVIEKITHDHSPVGEREDAGELTEEEAMRHPRRNEVFRDVGSEPREAGDEAFIEIAQTTFEPDAALLLCSDGLSDALRSEQILRIVERHAGDPEACVRELVAAASVNGTDNISAVLVEGQRFRAARRDDEITARLAPAAPEPAKPWPWALAGLLAGVLLASAGWWWFAKQAQDAEPRTLEVTAPGSIIEVLERARAGDKVVVGPGTYTGPIQLKDGVALVARPAYEATIVGAVVADGVRGARLEGFRVRDAEIGISVRSSDVDLLRNEITNNRRAGVEWSAGSRGTIAGCAIRRNGGPGIAVMETASPSIEYNLIAENAVAPAAPAPGLLLRSASAVQVVGNTFTGNGAEAIWSVVADQALLDNNVFSSAVSRPLPRVRLIAPPEPRP